MEEKNNVEKVLGIIAEFENQESIDAASRIIARTRDIIQVISAGNGEDSDEMHEVCNLIAKKCVPIVLAEYVRLSGRKSSEEELKRVKEVALRLSALNIGDQDLKTQVTGCLTQMSVIGKEMDMTLERPGCIVTWLVVCLIAQFVSLIEAISNIQYASLYGEYEWLVYYQIVSTLFVIVGIILLMLWRKIGFLIIVVVTILSTLLTISSMPSGMYSIQSLIVGFVGPFIWYAILQKTNSRGVRFWNLLK